MIETPHVASEQAPRWDTGRPLQAHRFLPSPYTTLGSLFTGYNTCKAGKESAREMATGMLVNLWKFEVTTVYIQIYIHAHAYTHILYLIRTSAVQLPSLTWTNQQLV